MRITRVRALRERIATELTNVHLGHFVSQRYMP